MLKAVALFALLTLPVSACDPVAPEDFPTTFRISGTAEGMESSLAITCSFDFIYEQTSDGRREPDRRVIVLNGGGDALRTVVDSTGAGIGLWPHMHSTSDELHLIAEDSIEIVSPLNLASPDPFYQLFGRLPGRRTEGGGAAGTWFCAPFNTRGDTTGIVTGRWRLEPTP